MSRHYTFPPSEIPAAQIRAHPLAGKISFGLFATNVVLAVFSIVFDAVIAAVSQPHGNSGGLSFLFIAIIAPIVSLIGLIFGIVGIFKKNHEKIFPILGIILNSLCFLCAAVLWILMGLALYAIANTPWR